MLEAVRNSTIYSVSSHMYYQYFTFKGLNYTWDIVFSLIFLQIFFQRNIFRKLRIIVISSSQWSVVSTFWVIWANVRCRLMKPLVLGDYTKIIMRFILHFSKMFLFRCIFCSKYILTVVVVTAWLSFTSSFVDCKEPSKKVRIFSFTPIFTSQLILKNFNET